MTSNRCSINYLIRIFLNRAPLSFYSYTDIQRRREPFGTPRPRRSPCGPHPHRRSNQIHERQGTHGDVDDKVEIGPGSLLQERGNDLDGGKHMRYT